MVPSKFFEQMRGKDWQSSTVSDESVELAATAAPPAEDPRTHLTPRNRSVIGSIVSTGPEGITMAEFDIHIKGGVVLDGTRAPLFHGDVWIKDGKIAQIGGRATGGAEQEIDADGLIVAPGFVDLHTH
jgi:hypothetical protein